MKTVILIRQTSEPFTDNERQETARILRALAERVERLPYFSPGADMPLFDKNGDETGFCTVLTDTAVWRIAE